MHARKRLIEWHGLGGCFWSLPKRRGGLSPTWELGLGTGRAVGVR